MKKIVFVFICLLCYSFNHAQEAKVEKGLVIGGSLSGTFQQNIWPRSEMANPLGGNPIIRTESKNTTIGFFVAPYIGKKINPKSIFAFTPILGFNHDSSSSDEITNFLSKTFTLGGGLFYRYYINPKSKIKGFVQPFTNYTASFGNIERFAPVLLETRTYAFNLGVSFGAVYDINDNWKLLMNVWSANFRNSSFTSGEQEDPIRNNFFGFNFSIRNVRFGIERNF